MSYSFTCPCNNQIPVAASSAGSELVCQCGSKAVVPRLSQLRVMAGQGAYEAGTIDTIQRMLEEGKLPWGETCAVSGVTTAESMEVYVECEKVYFKEDHRGWLFAVAVLVGAWWTLLFDFSTSNQDPQGRETLVRTPLRVAVERQPTLARTVSQRRLSKLLRTVPIYARLLKDYPKARIVVGPLPVQGALKFDPSFASR